LKKSPTQIGLFPKRDIHKQMFCKYSEALGIESVASNCPDCKHRPINHIFGLILFTIKQRLTNDSTISHACQPEMRPGSRCLQLFDCFVWWSWCWQLIPHALMHQNAPSHQRCIRHVLCHLQARIGRDLLAHRACGTPKRCITQRRQHKGNTDW